MRRYGLGARLLDLAWLWAPALALLWKAWWLARDAFPFHADEAIVALMARHIRQGARPVFFYGQAYMGSLDACLVAAGFALLGERVLTVRVVQAVLYALTVGLSVLLARRLTGSAWAGAAVGVLLAVPTVNMTLYTTITLGGYNEALLLGTAGLLVAVAAARRRWAPGALGLLLGLGLWVNALSWVYLVPAVGYAWTQAPRPRARWALFLLAAAVLGAVPWWGYAWQHGWREPVLELVGHRSAQMETGPWLLRSLRHALHLVLLGIPVTLGLRPPWDVTVLVPPLAVPVVALYAAWLYLWRRTPWRHAPAWRLPLAVAGTMVAAFVFSSFGLDPTGRYFLPLTHMLLLFMGAFVAWLRRQRPSWARAALLLLLGYHAVSTVQAAAQPYRLTALLGPHARIPARWEMLAEFLAERGFTRGYSTYWIAYPLAFLSDETLLLSPRLPYHADLRYTSRDDRIPAYTQAVCQARQPVYVVAEKQRALQTVLRTGFRAHGLTWREAQVGPYRVFYDLSRPIAPWDLGLSPPPEGGPCERQR